MEGTGKVGCICKTKCVSNGVYRAPRSRFFPGKTARARGVDLAGSLQIKENDVYMREGYLSRLLLPTGSPRVDFSPENLRGARGVDLAGSLQIKENDVYMREGYLSRLLLPTGPRE